MKQTILFLFCLLAGYSLSAQNRNMLLNGDFEDDLTNGWVNSSSNAASIITTGGIRGNSLKVTPIASDIDMLQRRIVNLQKYVASYGEQYQVTFKAKTIGTGGTVQVAPELNLRENINQYRNLFSDVDVDQNNLHTNKRIDIVADGMVHTYTLTSKTVGQFENNQFQQADFMDFLFNFYVPENMGLIVDDVELIRLDKEWDANIKLNSEFALGPYGADITAASYWTFDGYSFTRQTNYNNTGKDVAIVTPTNTATGGFTGYANFLDIHNTSTKQWTMQFTIESTVERTDARYSVNSSGGAIASATTFTIHQGTFTYSFPISIPSNLNAQTLNLWMDINVGSSNPQSNVIFHNFYLIETIALKSFEIMMPQEVLIDNSVPVAIWANPTSADNAVTLSVNNELGEVTQNADRTWSYKALAEGEVTITATSKIDGTKTDQFIVKNVTAATWIGKTNKWDDGWYNWATREVPGATTNVLIPKMATGYVYPMLEAGKTAGYYACNTITFKPGAEIGRQDLLSSTSAKVEYNLKPGRWHMLSIPVSGDVETGDFSLRIQTNDPAAPKTWLRKFVPEGAVAAWPYYKSTTEPLAIGEGFSFWIEKKSESNSDFTIEGSLAGSTAISRPISFATSGETAIKSPFAFVGNPYMTSINFDQLRLIANGSGTNGNIISANYIIHNGSAFVGYTPDGNWGAAFTGTEDRIDRIIPPLQAFIVEAAGSTSGDQTIQFGDLANLQATGTSAGLRKANTSYGKLDIIAENGTIPVLTFIANRENGESARKLKADINVVPDIYTLAQDNETALGAQLIDSDINDIIIPLGIATSKSGEMSLSFSGMETYPNVDIALIDRETNIPVDLNEQPVYNFTYTPPMHPTKKDDNGNPVVLANENRFFIAFSPSSITGMKQVQEQKITVSTKGNELQVLGSTDNLIKEVLVYTMQGQLLFADYMINQPVYTTTLTGSKGQSYLVKVISEKNVQTVKLLND